MLINIIVVLQYLPYQLLLFDLGGAKVIYYNILDIINNIIYVSCYNILPVSVISANLNSAKINCHLSQLSQNKGGGSVAICHPAPLVVMQPWGVLQGTADSWCMYR